jgi:hypothetical protein
VKSVAKPFKFGVNYFWSFNKVRYDIFVLTQNRVLSFLVGLLLSGCVSHAQTPSPGQDNTSMKNSINADVLSVETTGKPSVYQFNVKVSSPDTGCDQYADWWEVLSEDGQLLYRRVLLHSHVNEQPFTRSGGPVPISSNKTVYVRAHMNTSGYGGSAVKGTVESGFQPVELDANFAAEVESQQPLPEGCDF